MMDAGDLAQVHFEKALHAIQVERTCNSVIAGVRLVADLARARAEKERIEEAMELVIASSRKQLELILMGVEIDRRIEEAGHGL